MKYMPTKPSLGARVSLLGLKSSNGFVIFMMFQFLAMTYKVTICLFSLTSSQIPSSGYLSRLSSPSPTPSLVHWENHSQSLKSSSGSIPLWGWLWNHPVAPQPVQHSPPRATNSTGHASLRSRLMLLTTAHPLP